MSNENMFLFNGDCLEGMKLLPDNSIDAVICDPPYGTTACKWDTVIPLSEMWKELKRVGKNNTPFVIFAAQPFTSNLIMSNIKQFKYDFCWNKVNALRNHLNAKKQPMRIKEDICVFYKKQPTYNPQMREGSYVSRKTKPGQSDTFGKVTGIDKGKKVNSLYPHNIISIKGHDPNNNYHPTQKPVELMEYLIKTYTNKNDTVLDFTMGGGSTGIACKNLNRIFYGIENEEKYFNIGSERIFNA